MNKIAIIIQREYMTRVRKKSFILLTFLMPVLFVCMTFGTVLLSTIKDGNTKNIVVYDETGKYFPVLRNTEQYHFLEGGKEIDLTQAEKNEGIYATLVISKDLLIDPSAIILYSDKQVTKEVEYLIINQLTAYLSDEKLNSYQIPDLKKIIEESKVTIHMQTIKWDEEGNEKISSSELATAIGMIFTFIIYMFIFAYGGMVMQGVLEEKTNRIVEVMVSSVKPFDLMMGKIIGIGLVGLTQFFLWAILIGAISISGGLFFTPPTVASGTIEVAATNSGMQELFGMISSINLFKILFFFIVYFIGGYMIYASLFAAIGSMVNSQEDTQQFMLPVTILVLFAFYSGIYSINNPDGPLAFWTSMIPFFSPIVMMTRLPFDIPTGEILLSIALLYATVFLMIKLTAKIYKTGILMYGKKPNLKEVWKWLKY